MDTNIVPLTNPSSKTSTKRGLTSRLEEASTSLRARILLDQWRLPAAYENGKSPSEEEKTEVMAMIAGIRSGLSREVATEDLRQSVRLLVGGLKSPAGMEAKSMAAAYFIALEGTPASVLTLAVKNFLTGDIPESLSKVFLPTAPELSWYCGYLEKYLTALADRTEQILALPEARSPRPEMTEEEQAERRKQIQTLVMAPFKGEPS